MRQVLSHPANDGRRVRQLAIAVRAHVSNRVFRRPTTVPLGDHSRIMADVRFGGSMLVAYANPPDAVECRVWRQHLRPGDLFVDVGANVGVYSVLAAELGAVVVAVEADPLAVKQLELNMRLNGYAVEVHRTAVAAEVGEVHFSAGSDTMNSIRAEAGSDTRSMACTTLDELVGGRVVAGLKIDVEGVERLVLEGARGLLGRGVGLLQIEWNGMSMLTLGESREPIEALLKSAGYVLLRPDPSGRLHEVCDPQMGSDVFARRAISD